MLTCCAGWGCHRPSDPGQVKRYRCRLATATRKEGAKGRIKLTQNSTPSEPPELSPHIRVPLDGSSILFLIPEAIMSLYRVAALLVMCGIALSAVGKSGAPQNSATK